MAYDVTIERTSECPTAVVKVNTTWREFGMLWPALLDAVWALLRSTPGLRTDGHNVMLYRHGPREARSRSRSRSASKSPDRSGPNGRVVPSILPATEAAVTLHVRNPTGIGAAHAAVRAWCSAQRRELTGVSCEIYGDLTRGPGTSMSPSTGRS